MEVVYLLGSVQAIFLSILVFVKHRKTTADHILGAWLAFLGIHLLYFYLFATGFLHQHPHLLGIGVGFPSLEPAFMFVYVLVMTSRSGRFRSIYLLNGIPFLIVTLYFVVVFYHLTASGKLDFYSQIINDIPWHVRIMTFPNIIMWPIYVLLALFRLSRHSRSIAEQFSYREQINLKWLKYLIAGIGFVSIISILVSILVRIPLMNELMDDKVLYLAYTISVFFIGFFGIKQQVIYAGAPNGSQESSQKTSGKRQNRMNQYLHSGLKKDKAEQYANALRDYFKNEKPYLKGKLTLATVADHMSISVNHLSQVINEQIGMTFFDFVNKYRIEEVKSRIKNSDHENFTLLGIAYDSGFNSKSSFNSIFKKFTGFTPSQFARQKIA